MNKKGGELVSDGLCGLGFPLIPVFLSEEKRYSGSLSLQWREGVQVLTHFKGETVFRYPPLLKGGGNQVPSPLRGEG